MNYELKKKVDEKMRNWYWNENGEALNLLHAKVITAEYDDEFYDVWAKIDDREYLLESFETIEEAHSFIKNLVDELNAPPNLPDNLTKITKNFLDSLKPKEA